MKDVYKIMGDKNGKSKWELYEFSDFCWSNCKLDFLDVILIIYSMNCLIQTSILVLSDGSF